MTLWELLKNFSGNDLTFTVKGKESNKTIIKDVDYYKFRNVLDYELYDNEEEYNLYYELSEKTVLSIDFELNLIIIEK